jgi:hypothetical protein
VIEDPNAPALSAMNTDVKLDRKSAGFGMPRAATYKRTRYKFIEFIRFSFIKLGYELGVFASSYKFIKFILVCPLHARVIL